MPHNQSLLLTAPILIIDDDEAHALMVCRMLDWAGYANITVATKPSESLALYSRLDPDLVLLDLKMSGVHGGSLIHQLRDRSQSSFLPILVFTGPVGHDVKAAALKAGASDFLSKPGDSNEVLVRVTNFLQMRHLRRKLRNESLSLEELIRIRTEDQARACQEMAERLATAAEYRGLGDGGHAQRVGGLSAQIATAMGLHEKEVDLIRLTAPLHDVGNVGVPDEILLKPGPLNSAERDAMKRHTLIGSELFAKGRSEVVRSAQRIAVTHHERWDGDGYPNRLRGEEIPLPGRIVAVADVFDALTHDRPYKRSWALDESVFEIERLSGSHFDPNVVRAFKQTLSQRAVA